MLTHRPLSEVFGKAAGPHSALGSDLEVRLVAYLEAARAPWPDFGIDSLDFVRYVAERARGGEVPPLCHAPDLWLSCACVQAVPAALACFMQAYEPLVTRVLVRRGAAADVAADVRQLLAESLFVADPRAGRRAKIADYKGLGALSGWIASAAATTLLAQQRASVRRREQPESALDASSRGLLDPELEYLKRRYSVQVHDAIVAALETLSARDKALLRLHLRERLNIDRLGSMYGVNRATAARWLAVARDTLKERTLEQLHACLQLNRRECESLFGLVNSQLDVSLIQHLPPDPDKSTR